jgi:amino acid adenylation domain-containing protein/thioester reductase-like protein
MQVETLCLKYYVPNLNIAKFDLLLEAVLEEENLILRFEYCTKLFTEEYMNRFAKHYINVLKEVLQNIDIKVSDIEIIDKKEKKKILEENNNNHTRYERDKTVIQLFEKQVERTPNKIAITFEENELTYKQLNEKSNQLANYMIKNFNIQKQDKVAIFVKKSFESVIAIIATIKAGAIFVPIDIEYPNERIDYILQDSGAKIVLTLEEFERKIKDKCTTLNIDLKNDIYKSKAIKNPKNKLMPKDLIYIMYTSGSTGKPKGVMVEHRNVVRLVRNTNYIDFSKCERILQTGSIVFDACTFEIWGALLNGLSLYIIKKKELLDCNIFEQYLIKNQIDTLWLTAPLFNQLSEENPYMFKKIKYLLTGGDVLSVRHINMVMEANPNINIINGYGPTENTTFSCCFRIDKKYKTSIPIGKAIANSTAYVVSKNQKIQPIGIPGELWVGGDGVSKGYLNREDLTNEKFIPNPFGDGIIYKTGDLVKLLPSGNIEFIGRLDKQVKIRGFRVELSEIDNVIKQYPNITKLFTEVKEINGNKTLVTYITSDRKINIQDIILYLQERLPYYMIPQYIMQLDQLPLTINGKVDKAKLPIPKLQINSKYVGPENEVQEQLCEIWKKLFNAKKISILDNFFELGGDSLLAIKLQTEALKLDININYSDIFEYPTIKGLSERKQDKQLYKVDDNYDYSKINEEIKINNISNIEKNIDSKISDNKQIGNLLLLGSTGFLGAHILNEYLEQTEGNIYCLVRRKNNEDPEERLRKTLSFYFGEKYDEKFNKRIFLIQGDITKEKFGLNEDEYYELSKNIDIVINSAALVKHFGDFDMFKSINVLGTKNIIDFCKKYNKKMYHISTMSVAGMSSIEENITDDGQRKLFCENNLYIGQNLNNAYVYTKFEAEKEILEEISNGLEACIFRMGNIFSRYSDGRFQINVSENAYINRIKAILNLGMVQNRFLNHALEFTPVDFAAKAIIEVIKDNTKFNILHMFNTNLIDFPNVIAILNDLGYKIEIVEDKTFAEKVKKFLGDEQLKNKISGIIPELRRNKTLSLISNTLPNAYFTTKYLNSIGFYWPEIESEYISKFFEYFKKIGYIE